MAVEDLLAVYTPHSAALCRYLVARSDVASTELDNGWLVARGHLRGAGAARELPTSQPPDGLRVISGPAELLKDGPARRRFRHVLREDPSRLARFPGDFTALVLEAHGRVSFARCCSGTTPLYVASQGEHVAISTRLDWLAVSLPWSVHPDWLPIAVYAAGWAAFPDQRSPIRGITRVALGHAGSVGVNVP